MGAQINCPNCGQTYSLTDAQVPQYSGQTITCTKCQQPFTVPTLTAPPPPLQSQPPAYPAPMSPQPYPQQSAQGIGYGTPMPAQRTNAMAIVSVVCGGVGFVFPFIPGIIGLIFGILGLRKTRDPAIGGKALAITGISLSGVSFLMGTCILSILLPSLNRARETANRVKCSYNLKAIGQALLLYGNDNQGSYPPDFETLIKAEDLAADVFVCPASDDSPATPTPSGAFGGFGTTGHLSYVYVGKGLSFRGTGADTVIVYEKMADHQQAGANFLYGDGHVDWLSAAQAQAAISQLDRGINPPK